MAERLIDANRLIKRMKAEEAWAEYMEDMRFEDAYCLVEEAPTVEAKPVVHAHWNQIANGFMVCSHCEKTVEENRKYSFCPLCGAQMDSSEVKDE